MADSPYSIVVTPGAAHGLTSSAYGAGTTAAVATLENTFYVQVGLHHCGFLCSSGHPFLGPSVLLECKKPSGDGHHSQFLTPFGILWMLAENGAGTHLDARVGLPHDPDTASAEHGFLRLGLIASGEV